MGLFDKVWHLPLNWFGLKHIPAVPIQLAGLLDTILKRNERAKEALRARHSLTNLYTIDGQTATGEQFLYGPSEKLMALSLEHPEQFAMSWPNFEGVFARYAHLIRDYAATLTDPEEATRQFWPFFAEHGTAYNLLILRKVGTADLARLQSLFAPFWPRNELARGKLFFIDMSIFTDVPSGTLDGFTRFTPATVTLLEQDPDTKALKPFAVRVSGQDDAGAQIFVKGQATPSAWLYALQAARTSLTVYGIWLGHVYHWHIVTAAMQMTMYNTFRRRHPVYQLLAPQSNYLFQFDELLLLVWNAIAPPTSVTTRCGILHLLDRFAEGRDYFADDPTTTLQTHGIVEADFTRDKPWDLYPAAQRLLQLFSYTQSYVEAFVTNTYANDQLVAEDRHLQKWMRKSGHRHGGNIRGLPVLNSRAALTRVLTSMIYRITAHGISRMMPSVHPALTFLGNAPPCLQIDAIPSPQATLTTGELLAYLPKTGTIGSMMNFGTTFAFTTPYVPFVPEVVHEPDHEPKPDPEADLFFPGGLDDPRNAALVAYRQALMEFINAYSPDHPTIGQWPRNIEL